MTRSPQRASPGKSVGTEHALRFADLTSVAQAGLAALGMVIRGSGQRVIRFDQNRRRRRSRLSSSAREQRRSAGATGSAAAELAPKRGADRTPVTREEHELARDPSIAAPRRR